MKNKKSLLFAIVILIIFLSGCGLSSRGAILDRDIVIPEGVAQTGKELVAKVQKIPIGASYEDVVKFLNIKIGQTPNVRDVVDRPEKQSVLYGSVNVNVTPENVDAFRKTMIDPFKIIAINLNTSDSSFAIDSAVSIPKIQDGDSLTVKLIFFNDMFKEAIYPENYKFKNIHRTYITNAIGGALTGGIGRGVGKIP